jgi:hypothetical protein
MKLILSILLIIAIGEYYMHYNGWQGGTRQLRKVTKELNIMGKPLPSNDSAIKEQMVRAIETHLELLDLDSIVAEQELGLRTGTLSRVLSNPDEHDMALVLYLEAALRSKVNAA